MKTFTTLKLTSAAIIGLALTSGFAIAGEGHKDCAKKKTTARQNSTTTTTAAYSKASTSVAGSTEHSAKKMKVMSYDAAVELCTSKKVTNLQACVAKKTGKTKPES